LAATHFSHGHFPTRSISLKSFAGVVKLFSGYFFISVADVFTCKIILRCRRRTMMVTRCKEISFRRAVDEAKCFKPFFYFNVINALVSLVFVTNTKDR